MIRQAIRRSLHAPLRWRIMADLLALALASVALPRIAERVALNSWPGFALTMVVSTAALLAAAWAVVPPTRPAPAPLRPAPRQATTG